MQSERMSAAFLTLHFLTAFIVTHGYSPDCRRELEKCQGQYSFQWREDLHSAVTEEELEKYCKRLSDWIPCMTHYVQQCGEPQDLSRMEALSVMLRRLSARICNPGDPFIPRFLNYTRCYFKFDREYVECGREFIREQNHLESLMSAELNLQESCCNLGYYLHCTRTAAESRCGKDVADTGEEIIEIIADKTTERICSAFKYDSPQCSSFRSTTTRSLSSPDVSSKPIRGGSINCESKPLECGIELVYLRTHGLLSAVTENTLLEACNSSREYIACVTDYAMKCRKPGSGLKVKEAFSGLSRLMNSVCIPGDPFIPLFLNYTACYSNFAEKYQYCHSDFMRERERVMQSSIYAGFKQQQFCCYYKYFEHCVKTATLSKCGKDVADTGKEVIARLIGDDVVNTCLEVEYDSPQCSSLNTSTTTPSVISPFATSQSATEEQTAFSPCSEFVWDECSKHLAALMKMPGFPSELTDEELSMVCVKILPESLACEKEFVEKCLHDSEEVTFGNTTAMAGKLLEDSCSPRVSNASSCNESVFYECSKPLRDFMKMPVFPTELTDEDLRMLCHEIIPESLACGNAFSQKCFDPSDRVEFRNITTKVQRLLVNACTPVWTNYPSVCESSKWNRCLKQMEDLTPEGTLTMKLPEEVASFCIILGKGYQCAKHRAKVCPKDSVNGSAEAVLDEARKLVSETCNQDAPKECELSQKCVDDFIYLKKHGILQAVTENELQRACNSTKEATTCVLNFAEKCLNTKLRSQIEEEFARYMPLVTAVCVQGDPFVQRFLNFTACSPKFDAQVKQCENYFLSSEIPAASSMTNSELQQICCFFNSFLHCASTAVERKCGKEIARTGIEVFEKLFPKSFGRTCTILEYEGLECASFLGSSTRSTNATTSAASTTNASTTDSLLNTPATFKNAAVHLGSFQSFRILSCAITALLYR